MSSHLNDLKSYWLMRRSVVFYGRLLSYSFIRPFVADISLKDNSCLSLIW